MEDLQKRVDKLEKTNTILNLLLIILLLAIIMIGIQLHFTNKLSNQIFTYFNDLNNGTYEEVMNFHNDDGTVVSFAGVGSTDDLAELDAYFKRREYYFENR